MKSTCAARLAAGATAALLAGAPVARAHGSVAGDRTGDLAALAEAANLVILGEVAEVSYGKARIAGGDGELPYTLVTYKVRQTLRGQNSGSFTLRVPGGSDGRGHFVEVSGVPVFQPGEQDLLFLSGNGDKGCPLVECEWGRFRILKDAVYDTHGSPVRGLLKGHAIARGLPPEEFRTFSYPAPAFDELVKNPEVEALLKAQSLTIDDARRRYAQEAPKRIAVRTSFDEAAAGAGGTTGAQGADTKAEPVKLAGPQLETQAVSLTRFLALVRSVTAKSKRAPSALPSIDPKAVLVVDITPREATKLADPKPGRPGTTAEEAELKAYLAADSNPVVKR